jgi:5-methylcytosine-specific restriction enzyme B
MVIPQNIKKEHILQAAKQIDRDGVPARRRPTTYHVIVDGEKYPPIYIVELAIWLANGEKLNPGALETLGFLKGLGFQIIPIKEGS